MASNHSSVTKNLGLPSHYYTDPEILKHELRTIWRSSWHWVGRVEELPSPGDYLTATVGEEPLLIVRTADGSLQAMHNVCPHRGARLLNGQGNCTFIQCPYHAWTYSLEGKLLAVSQPKLFPGLDKAEIQLLPARVDTWGGFIFANPDAEGESLTEYLADYPSYLSEYQYAWEELQAVSNWSHDEPVNWKFLIENFVEDYHFVTVHSASLGSMYDSQNIRTIPMGRHIAVPVPYAKKEPTDEKQKKRWQPGGGISQQGFIFPNTIFGTYKNTVLFARHIPLSPTMTRIEAVVYQTPEQNAADPFTREAMNHDKVMDEDFTVCRLLQAGVNSRAYKVSRLALEHELGVAHFHQILSKYY